MSTKPCSTHADRVKTGKKCDKLLCKKPQGVRKKKRTRRSKKKQRNNPKHHDQKHTRPNFPNFHHRRQNSTLICKTGAMDQPYNPAQSFWDNYKNAMQWQNKHFMNYWKSRCSALELENQQLYKTIELLSGSNLQPQNSQIGPAGDAPGNLPDLAEEAEEDAEDVVEAKEQKFVTNLPEVLEAEEIQEEYEEDFTFEVDDQMLEFLEISAKHKIELKKKREIEREMEAAEEAQKEPEKVKLPREIMEERKVEMEKLYGADSAPMILGMETAMQLSFDRFNDKYQPKHWPNIPLNL